MVCREAARNFLALIAPHITDAAPTFSSQDCATLLWCYASAGMAPAPLLNAVLQQFGTQPLQKPEHLTRALWAMAELASKCGWQAPDCSAAVRALQGREGELELQHVTQVLGSVPSLPLARGAPEPLLRALDARAAQLWLDKKEDWPEMAHLFAMCMHLGFGAARLAQAIAVHQEAAAQRVRDYRSTPLLPHDAAKMLWSLLACQVHGGPALAQQLQVLVPNLRGCLPAAAKA